MIKYFLLLLITITDTQMVQLYQSGVKAQQRTVNAFPVRKLTKSNTQKLFPARKTLHLVVSIVAIDNGLERSP